MVLVWANTMARYRKGAERSSPAAQTSGSARGVLVLSFRLSCTPLATPSTPVTQVMAPKIRLREERRRQGSVLMGTVEGEDDFLPF